ncbi:MAG: TIGR04255 family protein, partial [Pseudomonadota bacterium]
VRLPAAAIPGPVADQDPAFKHVPKIRLEGSNRAIQIGGHVLALSCRRPYSGWKSFFSDIMTLIGVARKTNLIESIERFSLKYLDLIELDHPPDLSCLNVELKVGTREVRTQPLNIHTEIQEAGLLHIIRILSPAEAAFPEDSRKLTGVLLDIDTIHPMGNNESWDYLESRLSICHSASKAVFFGLLTPETLSKLEPEYEE